MKTIKIIPFLLLTSLLSLFSCYEFIEFDLKDRPEPKLVLNSTITADSSITANVSKSFFLYDFSIGDSGVYRVDSVEIDVYINGILKGRMTKNTGSKVIFPTHYSSFRAKEGDHVLLKATFSDGREISGESSIIERVQILSLDTLSAYDGSSGQNLNFYIKFKDLEAGKRNYYSVSLVRIESVYDEDGVLLNTFSYRTAFEYEQDPALSTGFNDKIMQIIEDGESVAAVRTFSDELFDGKEYTLNIRSRPSYSYSYYNPDSTITKIASVESAYQVILLSLSEPLYLYGKSIDLVGDNTLEQYGLSEPVKIFSNVKKGLGVVGSYGKSSKIIIMPEGK